MEKSEEKNIRHNINESVNLMQKASSDIKKGLSEFTKIINSDKNLTTAEKNKLISFESQILNSIKNTDKDSLDKIMDTVMSEIQKIK